MVDDPLISLITWFSSNFAPRDWAFCGGQLENIADNSALFALMGTSYGGDGRVTFGIPDLRGRTPVGCNDMGNPIPPLVPIVRGQRVGWQTMTLSSSELPQHNHTATFTPGGASGASVEVDVQIKANSDNATAHGAGDNDPSGNPALSMAAPKSGLTNVLGYNASTPDVALDGIEASGTVSGITVNGTVAMADSGSSNAFSILNPLTGLNACIAMVGTFPARN